MKNRFSRGPIPIPILVGAGIGLLVTGLLYNDTTSIDGDGFVSILDCDDHGITPVR
jgi:hypothetical protein